MREHTAKRTFWVFLLLFAAVAVCHLTLLRLPYYWDEGGYYIPAALDFYRRWTLIPEFTNAHPPLPNVVLGLLWHVVGYHIVATRLCAAAFAAAGLTAIFRLSEELLDTKAAVALTGLVAVYPIWFAQSTLAHADIFAAALTLWGFRVYLGWNFVRANAKISALTLFSLAALAKETAIVEPIALICIEAVFWLREPENRREHARWIGALSFPVLPLAAWYGYHRFKTGFMFGNPEYLRYNATANFTVAHVAQALRYRFVHLFWQRNIWLPILLAVACLLLPKVGKGLKPRVLVTVAVLVVANWVAFSILGGALLTRYLLPIYPLILLVCVALWQERTAWWPALAVLTAVAFVSALWINPAVSFAPEDNLTYRDMIVVHQEAAAYVASHFPHATVMTAWPVAADLVRPELGYVAAPMRVTSVENFSLEEMQKAAQRPGDFDTAIVFSTHFMSPALERYLVKHPESKRGSEFNKDRDLTPRQIAGMLHGRVVWQDDRGGEWAAVLRFDRTYEAENLGIRDKR